MRTPTAARRDSVAKPSGSLRTGPLTKIIAASRTSMVLLMCPFAALMLACLIASATTLICPASTAGRGGGRLTVDFGPPTFHALSAGKRSATGPQGAVIECLNASAAFSPASSAVSVTPTQRWFVLTRVSMSEVSGASYLTRNEEKCQQRDT